MSQPDYSAGTGFSKGYECRKPRTSFPSLYAARGAVLHIEQAGPVISALLVDENRLFRAGLRRLLEGTTDISVAGDLPPGPRASELAYPGPGGIIVIGISACHESMTSRIAELLSASPSSKVIVILARGRDAEVRALLAIGVRACLDHDCSEEELLTAIRRVHAGASFLSAGVAEHLVAGLVSISEGRPFGRLSLREAEVARMIAGGMKSKEIALRMAISPMTVAAFRHRLFKKLNVRSDVEMTRLALREEFVQEF